MLAALPFLALLLWQLIFIRSFDDDDLWLGSVPTISGEPVAVVLPGVLLVGIATGVATRLLVRRLSLSRAPSALLFGLTAATLPIGAGWAIGAGCPVGDRYALPEDPTTTYFAFVVPALVVYAVAAVFLVGRDWTRLLPVAVVVAAVVGVLVSFAVSGGPNVCDWNI